MNQRQFASCEVKRSLSKYEKSTLINTSGNALVMPSESGTEIEELTTVGYDPRIIDAVEMDREKYHQLESNYGGLLSVYNNDIFDHMKNTSNKYTYIHVDLYGQLTANSISNDMQYWVNAVDPNEIARVRMTVHGSRFIEQTLDFYKSCFREMITPLFSAYGNYVKETNSSFPIHYISTPRMPSTDPLTVILFIAWLNFECGIHDYLDFVTESSRSPCIPYLNGTHTISNVNRFRYHEATTTNWMMTIWFDLIPEKEKLRDPIPRISPLYDFLTYLTPTYNI